MKSIVCKNCLPKEYHHKTKSLQGFWNIDYTNKTAKCENCEFERVFYPRSHSNKITPSQYKSIEKIRNYFEDKGRTNLHQFEFDLTDYGLVFVTVRTIGNVYTMEGGHFSIGRKGAIKVHNSYSLYTKEKHYAKMLGGKVG